MATAVSQFADECEYDDTQYAGAFSGKPALEAHLNRVADALPPTFRFCIDEVADGGDTVGVQWHVENDGVALPFTRGCSMYKTDADGLLVSGFDVPEPAPLKPGSAGLALLSLASKLIKEPIRGVPLVAWGLYCTIVFFSNGILPGPDATQLDAATWKEVLDLSLNFWLISPLLNLPIAATVHPGLELIFNFLLAWAAAFGGFLVDGRKGRPSGSMVPTVLWMQLLTNAFFLPYLATRAAESGEVVYKDEFDEPAAIVGESRVLGPLLATVGTVAIAWGVAARPEFGDLGTRLASLGELLSNDRLGSSFVVDLALFACFQGCASQPGSLNPGRISTLSPAHSCHVHGPVSSQGSSTTICAAGASSRLRRARCAPLPSSCPSTGCAPTSLCARRFQRARPRRRRQPEQQRRRRARARR